MTSSVSLVPLLLLALGCSALDNCPDGMAKTDPPIVIDSGAVDESGTSYASAPWNGELHAFHAKSNYRFTHELGFTPLIVKVYLSYDKHGTNNMEAGSVAESAGNQDLIQCVDSHVIDIRNDTCEDDFFITVRATGRDPTDLGDECTRTQ
jgi:hypothetical protein